MIPKIRFLRRATLKAPSGAAYIPDLLALYTPELAENPEISKLQDYDLALVHENCHWLHHHGTTFGIFLTFLRRLQQNTTYEWLRNLPKPKLTRLLELRRAGRPIMAIHPESGQLTSRHQDHTLDILSQILHDILYIQNLFMDPSNMVSTVGSVGAFFGEICGDIFLLASAHGLLDYPGNDHARRSFRFEDDQFGLVQFGQTRVGAAHIMESLALSSELQKIADMTPGREGWIDESLIAAKVDGMLSSSYGIPFRLMASILGMTRPRRVIELLPALNALCFAALNPPLPPVVTAPPAHREAWSWSELYPPARFCLLCRALPRVGLLSAEAGHDDTLNYLRYLSDASGVPIVLSYAEVFSRQRNRHRIKRGPGGGMTDYLDYVLFVQEQMERDRQSSLSCYVNCGEWSSVFIQSQRSISYDHDENGGVLWSEPLLWLVGDGIKFRGDNTILPLYSSLIVHVVASDLAADLACGSGDFDLSIYPKTVIENPEIRGHIASLVEHFLGYPVI